MAQTKAAPLKTAGKAKTVPAVEEKTFSDWIAYGIFAVLTLIFFKAQLFGERFFWEDFTELIYPNWTYAARHLKNFELPFWNPYIFNGMPFLADMQMQVFYPINWLLVFFVGPDGRVPATAMQFVIILHFLIAQVSMYKLLRSLGTSQAAALLGAVAYGFSGSLVMRTFHPIILYQLAWFPLILMFFHRAITRLRFSSAIAGGLVLGLTMLSGQPQTTLYNLFFLFLMTLWYFAAGLRRKELNGRAIVEFIACAAIPVAVGAGIFMIQYLPSQQLADLSERATMSYEKATEGSLQFSQIFSSIVPRLFGEVNIENPQDGALFYLGEQGQTYYFWETAFYCGAIMTGLALFAKIRLWRTRLASFLIFAAIFGFLFAMGKNSFVFPVFFELPYFKLFRSPARMMIYVTLALVILGALGFDELWKKNDPGRLKNFLIAMIAPLIIALGTATGSILGILKAPEQFHTILGSYGAHALGFVAVLIACGILLIRRTIPPIAAGAILFALTFTELYIQGAGFNASPEDPAVRFTLQPEVKNLTQPKPPGELFRTTMRMPRFMAMQRNQGQTDSIMLYEGYTTLLLQRRATGAPTQEENLDLLNVKYAIAIDSLSNSANFVQRPNYFPRAWMVFDAKTASPENSQKMMASGLDFRKTALVEQSLKNSLPGYHSASVRHTVTLQEYHHNSFRYKVQTPENGLLCFSEMWYPEWHAYLDGRPVDILRTNHSLRGVEIPEGTHTVEMRYEDKKFVTGATITGFTLLISIFALFITTGIDRKKKGQVLPDTTIS